MHIWLVLGLLAAPPPPAADFDKDGVADLVDDCPTDPGHPDHRGCPGEPKPAAPPPKADPPPPPAAPPPKVEITDDHLDLKEPVFFQTGSSRIDPKSDGLLAEVAAAIQKVDPNKVISVEGHTDDRGRRRTNLRLSKRRAQAVVDRLIRLGVAKARLRSVGHGPNDPIAPNDSAEGRALNRRVELLILP